MKPIQDIATAELEDALKVFFDLEKPTELQLLMAEIIKKELTRRNIPILPRPLLDP